MSFTDHTTIVNPDIDPDLNFESLDIHCTYYDQDDFLTDFGQNSNMKLLHINARS